MAVDDSRLGCGRRVEDVFITIDEPPTTHEAGCEYCREARATLHDLSVTAAELRRHDADDPDLQIGPGVKDAIMQIARTEVRRTRQLPLEQVGDTGIEATLTISELTVLNIIRTAADSVEGVRARRCTVEVDKTRLTTSSEPGPATVTVALHLTVSTALAGNAIPAAVTQLRNRIEDLLALETGLQVSRIDLTVEDLYDA